MYYCRREESLFSFISQWAKFQKKVLSLPSTYTEGPHDFKKKIVITLESGYYAGILILFKQAVPQYVVYYYGGNNQ